jgi:hypothetical protein
MDAVALKARAAAVSDTYACQGTRSAAILPFTSSLGGLCAASAAAAAEVVPLINGVVPQAAVSVAFPAIAALLAAAATVSKARCEVDASAAKAAAEAFAEAGYENPADESSSQVVKPVKGVYELIGLTLKSVGSASKRNVKRIIEKVPGGSSLLRAYRRFRDGPSAQIA